MGVEMRIDTEVLRQNSSEIKRTIGRSKLCGVVKANAYGHGIRCALYMPCDMFAVSNVREALELEPYAGGRDILILAGATQEEAREAAAHSFIVTVKSLADAERMRDLNVRVHVKIDTGMNRLGLKEEAEIVRLLHAIDNSKMRAEGVYSHFYSSQKENCMRQAERFETICGKYFGGLDKHMASSGTYAHPEYQYDMVRVGLKLFTLSPAAKVTAEITQVKDVAKDETMGYDAAFTAAHHMRIAIVRMGYADGIHRSFSKVGSLTIKGKKCKIVGNICMDMCAADITGIEAEEGDLAEYIGNAEEVACACDTISYEIFTSLGTRVERIYE